jgi:hypothetical protein
MQTHTSKPEKGGRKKKTEKTHTRKEYLRTMEQLKKL